MNKCLKDKKINKQLRKTRQWRAQLNALIQFQKYRVHKLLSNPSVDHPPPCSSMWVYEAPEATKRKAEKPSLVLPNSVPHVWSAAVGGGLLRSACGLQDKQTASSSSEPERTSLQFTEYQCLVPGQGKLVPQVPTVRYKRKVCLSPTTIEFLWRM